MEWPIPVACELPMKKAEVPQPNIFDLLRKRHEGSAWAFMEEVRNATGYSRRVTRTADALAMSLWPSRGLHIHGFEVKVSRSDWLRELKDPEKAEEMHGFCHYWWLAVDDPSIVQNGECPMTWGLLVRRKNKLVCEREPTFNEKALAPTYSFLAAILRRASGMTPGALIEKAREEGREAGHMEGYEKGSERAVGAQYERMYLDMRDKVRAFEDATGMTVSVPPSRLPKIGAIVELLTHDYNSPMKMLDCLARQAESIKKRCDETVAEIQAAYPALCGKNEKPE